LAEKVNDRTPADTPADSRHSSGGSAQGEHTASLLRPRLRTYTISDPIILSDDEPVGAMSCTDYRSLDVDFTSKRDPACPYVAVDELESGHGCGSETIFISNRLVADHQDVDHDSIGGVVDDANPRLTAGRPRSASARQMENEGTDIFADETLTTMALGLRRDQQCRLFLATIQLSIATSCSYKIMSTAPLNPNS
jgi:hypothetical protein